MKILDTKVMRGPNYWSIKRKKLVQFTLDLEELEIQPTNEIPGFYEGLQQLLPSLYDHRCSRGKSGGFFERVQEGTWMGHVVEHIALELQSLAGIKAGFGRTRGTGRTGVYHVVFEYDEEDAGIYAGHASISLCEAIINGQHFDVDHTVAQIRQLWYRDKPGPSTASILTAAKARNIPVMRLDEGSLFQLGYGCRQKRIEATITAKTSTIAVDIAGDKSITKDFLKNAHFPTPEGDVVLSEEEMLQVYKKAFKKLGPIGIGHLKITSREEADAPKVLERLRQCNCVLFSGGDQLRLCSVLGGTDFLDIIRERYQDEHFIIAGTSAGAAAMSHSMISGGEEARAYLKGKVDLSIGFGFLQDAIIDTHFDARGRFGRLVQAIAAQPGAVGVGLDEDTGIIVEKGRYLTAIGSSSVVLVDGSNIAHNNIADIRNGMPISVSGLQVHVLTNSDTFDLHAREFTGVKFSHHH